MTLSNINLKNSLLLSLGLLVGLNNAVWANPVVTGTVLSEVAKEVVNKVVAPAETPITTFEATPLNIALVGALAFAMIRFWTREADSKPVRYDVDKILNFEDMPEQLFYILDDGVIGHSAKGSFQKAGPVDPQTGKATTEFSTPVYPKGFFGWTSFYYKGIIKGVGTGWILWVAIETARDVGVNDSAKFIKAFGARMKNYLALEKAPNWAKLGLAGVVGGLLATTFTETPSKPAGATA